MEKKMLAGAQVYLVALFLFVMYACSPEPGRKSQLENEGTDADGISYNDTLGENQAVVYTVPTPYQVASLLKILNIDYSDDIISGKIIYHG